MRQARRLRRAARRLPWQGGGCSAKRCSAAPVVVRGRRP